jgi:hypothetical protein
MSAQSVSLFGLGAKISPLFSLQPSSSQRNSHVADTMKASFQGRIISALLGPRYDILASSEKIRFVAEPAFRFENVPDIGMDRFLVSDGKPLGTSGLGPCFAVCSIGTTRLKTPVLGLCHTSSILSCSDVLQQLKNEMSVRNGALVETIKTYVIGGQGPSVESPTGSLNEERAILKIAESEKIEGVLFNQVRPDDDTDSLCVLLTPQVVYVSKKDLFPVTGEDDGMSIFGGD